MEKFVLIGQSAEFLPAIDVLRSTKPDAEITIISCDGHLPYDRCRLPELISKKTKEKELFLADDAYYKRLNVQVLTGKEITRINFNRKRVFMEDRQHVDFDAVILADAPQVKLPNYKGVRRSGVFHLARLETVKSLVRFLPFAETVLVECMSWQGVVTALALKALGKEVILVVATEVLLSDIFSLEISTKLAGMLEKRGIQIVLNNGIEDILGETEVKAVRLKSGKVLASEMVILEDVAPDLKFLTEGELVVGERIATGASMCSNMAFVYAIDTVFQMESPKVSGSYAFSREASECQGILAAKAMCGEDGTFEMQGLNVDMLFGSVFTMEELAENADQTGSEASPVEMPTEASH
jgi:nitrite reductase (NADH) large subunit